MINYIEQIYLLYIKDPSVAIILLLFHTTNHRGKNRNAEQKFNKNENHVGHCAVGGSAFHSVTTLLCVFVSVTLISLQWKRFPFDNVFAENHVSGRINVAGMRRQSVYNEEMDTQNVLNA